MPINQLSTSPVLALAAAVIFSGHGIGEAAKLGINFQDGTGAAVTLDAFGVLAADWYNLPVVPGSNGTPFSSTTTITPPGGNPITVEWSARNTWTAGNVGGGGAAGENQVGLGYLDDSGSGYVVRLSGLRASAGDYKITLAASTDGGSSFENATLSYTSGPTVLTYPAANFVSLGGGGYGTSEESPLISALTANDAVVITTVPGDGRGTLSGILIDFTPSTTNVPVIETQPTAPTSAVFNGSSVTLTVRASGPNLSYQWRKGGVPISAASNASASTANLTLANITSADGGSYDVVVSGVGPAVTSTAATVVISPLTQPFFTTLPISQSFYVGYPATFTGAASGGEIAYVWKKGPTTLSTTATLSLAAITAADAGTYTLTATNPVGSVSTSVTLDVTTPTPGTYEAVQASQKPLLWYRYSETDGSGIEDTTPNVGSLGAPATGTAVNVTQPAAGALVGRTSTAASLNGVNSRILVPYQAAFSTAPFTAEAWVKPAIAGAAATNKCVLASGDFATPRAGWLIYQQPGGWNLRFYDQNGNNTSLNLNTTTAPVANTWYHLVATYNGTTATLYVNGVPTSGTPTGYVPGTSGLFSIGARSDSGFWWQGLADEVAAYPTALSSAAVLAHYNNGISNNSATSYPALVAADGALLHLRLDDPVYVPSIAKNAGTLGVSMNGAYRSAAVQTSPANPLISLGNPGPLPPDDPGFPATNTGLTLVNGYNGVPAPNITTNTLTVTTWIKRAEVFDTLDDISWAAWLGADGGFHIDGGASTYGELRYHWDGTQYAWNSGLLLPAEVWTFCALVIEPTRTTIYMGEGDTLRKASIDATHSPHLLNQALGFGGNQAARTSRNFVGQLDESALYARALSESELTSLFVTGTGAPLKLDIATGGVIEDTKPSPPLLPGLNFGSTWTATSADAASTTRTGVQAFSTPPGQQIQIPASPSIATPTGTLTCWVKSPAPTGPGSEAAMLYDFRTSAGTVFAINDAGFLFVQCAGGANTFTDTTQLADDLWHHVAITWNQNAAGTIAVYIDGIASSETTNTAAWSWPTSTAPLIGKSRDPYWRHFSGQLDDFRLYNQILSGAEIAQIKATGALAVPTALTLRYDFPTAGTGLTLTWPFGILETSTSLTPSPSWSLVPDATSPYPVIPDGARRFFRTRLP